MVPTGFRPVSDFLSVLQGRRRPTRIPTGLRRGNTRHDLHVGTEGVEQTGRSGSASEKGGSRTMVSTRKRFHGKNRRQTVAVRPPTARRHPAEHDLGGVGKAIRVASHPR